MRWSAVVDVMLEQLSSLHSRKECQARAMWRAAFDEEQLARAVARAELREGERIQWRSSTRALYTSLLTRVGNVFVVESLSCSPSPLTVESEARRARRAEEAEGEACCEAREKMSQLKFFCEC